MAQLDRLELVIGANATQATQALDRLVTKLNGLSTALSQINTSNLTNLANATNSLVSATRNLRSLSTLANSLNRLNAVSTTSLGGLQSELRGLSTTLDGFSANAQRVSELANSLRRLGHNTGAQASVNIRSLADSLSYMYRTLNASPVPHQRIIDMTNALARLSAQGRQTGTASRSVARGVSQFATGTHNATRGSRGLASAIGLMCAKFWIFIRGVKGLGNAIKSTADYIETLNYFGVSFSKVGTEWSKDFAKYGYENAESYAESFASRLNETFTKLSGITVDNGKGLLQETGLKNLGLNLQEVTQYAAQLASITNAQGLTGEATTVMSNSLTRLAGDISSLFNITYQEAADSFRSGLIGMSRALYKFGIDITNARLEVLAMELGLNKSVSEMTQGEKQQLRYLAILKDSKVAWGDLAHTINSPSNMLRQFTTNLKETGMVIGQLFIPILSKIMPIANGVTIAIKRMVTDIAAIMGIKIDFSQFGEGYSDFNEDIEEGVADTTEALKEWKNQLMGFDEINKLTSNSNVDAGLSNTIDLTEEIIKASEEYDKAWQEAFKNMSNEAGKWADIMEKKLEPLKRVIADLFSGDFFSAGQGVGDIASNWFKGITKILNAIDWAGIGAQIGKFLKGINWTEIFLSMVDTFVSSISSLTSVLFNSFLEAPVETAIITAIASWKFVNVLGAVTPQLQALGASMSSIIAGSLAGLTIGTVLAQIGFEIEKALMPEDLGEYKNPWEIWKAYFETRRTEGQPIIELGDIEYWTEKLNSFISALNGIDDVSFATFNSNWTDTEEKLQKFYDLSTKYAELSDFDKGLMKQLGEELTALFPSLKNMIDATTGAYKGTYDELAKILDTQRQIAFEQAKADKLKGAYSDYMDIEIELTQEQKSYENALASYEKIAAKYREKAKKETNKTRKEQYEAMARAYDMFSQGTFDMNAFKGGNGKFWSKGIYDYIKNNDEISMIYNYISGKTTNINELSKKLAETKSAIDNVNSAILTDGGKVIFGNEVTEYNKFLTTLNNIVGATKELASAPDNFLPDFDGATEGAQALTDEYREFLKTLENENQTEVYFDKLKANLDATFDKPYGFNFVINRKQLELVSLDIKSVVGNVTSVVKPITDTNSLNNTLNTVISKVGKVVSLIQNSVDSKLLSGAKMQIQQNIGAFSSTIKPTVDNNALKLATTTIGDTLKGITVGLGAGIGGAVIGTYATGGFPEDGLFFANHNELVGNFSNGKTAVANNEQITQGIANAVYPAVYNAMVSAMSTSNGGEITINLDGNTLFKSTQNQARKYTMQTGQPAFA